MFAVIETGGKQSKVKVDDIIFVEKLEVQEGEEFVFDKVLSIFDQSLAIGRPYLEGAKVNAKVLKQGRDKKILVFKYKPKKNEHHHQGHRQPYTKLVITSIIPA
jgi:large subunit ribosomal protein L21